ncbi:MAG: hypothetical protein QXN36_00195 [Candidatus Bathyarchaeia archaeon]
MKDPIKKALTRRNRQREIQPDPRLVLGVKFAVAMTLSLTAIEITHLIALSKWNSEIFSAITGLTGTLTGIFITQKA